tara:strand:+ start:204 stop:377 length:174 start_codon:yes stop_codon:yes gene_type:complete
LLSGKGLFPTPRNSASRLKSVIKGVVDNQVVIKFSCFEIPIQRKVVAIDVIPKFFKN